MLGRWECVGMLLEKLCGYLLVDDLRDIFFPQRVGRGRWYAACSGLDAVRRGRGRAFPGCGLTPPSPVGQFHLSRAAARTRTPPRASQVKASKGKGYRLQAAPVLVSYSMHASISVPL